MCIFKKEKKDIFMQNIKYIYRKKRWTADWVVLNTNSIKEKSLFVVSK